MRFKATKKQGALAGLANLATFSNFVVFPSRVLDGLLCYLLSQMWCTVGFRSGWKVRIIIETSIGKVVTKLPLRCLVDFQCLYHTQASCFARNACTFANPAATL